MKIDKASKIQKKEYKMKLLFKILLIISIPVFILLVDMTAFRKALDITNIEIDKPGGDTFAGDISGKKTVYIGVISRFSPHILYKGYQPVMDYLTRETPYHFNLKIGKNYDEAVTSLAKGEVDAAFLGSFIFVSARGKYHLHCFLKPLNDNGQPYLQAALVTTDTSDIFSVRDLVGKRLALPSAKSFSANWLPMYEFQQNGISIEDVAEIRHFPYHHMVIRQLLRGNVDAGVVKDRVAKEFTDKGIRICALSDPIPGSPMVAGEFSDPQVIAAITEALLKIDLRDEMLESWDPELANGFVKAKNEDYDLLEKLIISEEVK